MNKLPTGTVTFLFTDIENSTLLWEKFPEAMKPALAKHDSILRESVEANHGQVIKTTGDGIHAVFSTAIDAVAASIAANLGISQTGHRRGPPHDRRPAGAAHRRGGSRRGDRALNFR